MVNPSLMGPMGPRDSRCLLAGSFQMVERMSIVRLAIKMPAWRL